MSRGIIGNIIWSLAGIGFIAVTLLSVKNGGVQLRPDRIDRSTDPLGFWAAIIILGIIGLFGFLSGAFGLISQFTDR